MWVHGLSVPLGMPDLGSPYVRSQAACSEATTRSSSGCGRTRRSPRVRRGSCAGECVHCHDLEVSTCLPGTRLAGCPALEQSSECVECTEGAAQVALDGAHRVQSNESICAWECGQEFFLVEWGCVNCSTQGLACPPGQRWHACSERADAGCTPCPDLRLAKGSYHRRPTSSGQRETSARPNAVLACTTTRHSSPRAAAGTAGTARSSRCTRASSSSSSHS